MAAILDELTEPPAPNAGEAIPFLGETRTYEFIQGIAASGDIFLNVGGTWFGRRQEDVTDEEALRYIKSKTFRSGQELRHIQLGLPGVVGGGNVTSSSPASDGTFPGNPEVIPPLGGASATGSGGPTAAGESQCPENGEGGLYSPSGSPTVAPPTVKSKQSEEPASGINLSGCFENWGISSSQAIETASIEFSGLTAQQIKQILQRIPSTYKAMLEIAYKEGGDQ